MAVQSGAPYWLRLGMEQASPIKGCGRPDCMPEDIDPVDTYCERHGNLLVGKPSALRTVSIHAARVLVVLAFWAAAELNADVVLAMTGLIICGFLLGFPLRHYEVAQAFAVSCWPIAAFAVIGLRTQPERVRVTAILIVAAFALILALVHAVGLTVIGGPRRPTDAPGSVVAGVIAACFAFAAVAGGGAVALGIQSRLDTTFPRILLEFVAACVASIATLVLAVHSLVSSARRVDRDVQNLLWVPGKPARWRWTVTDRSSAQAQRPDAVDRIGRVLVSFVEALLRFLRMLFYYAIRTLIGTVNVAHRALVRAWRQARAALSEALVTIGLAVRVGLASLVHSLVMVFFPLALMLVAAYVVDTWASWAVIYARGADPMALLFQLLNAFGAIGALTLTWMILSGEPPREVFPAAGRAASIAGANALVLLAAGGWVVGLLSPLLSGVVRVGWATFGATAVLVVVTLWSRIRRRGASMENEHR